MSNSVQRHLYAATRFSNRHYAKWQPGFMLSFLAQNFLRDHGYALWDLGGFNSSPMMSYKEVVAEPLSRERRVFELGRRLFPLPEESVVGDGQRRAFSPASRARNNPAAEAASSATGAEHAAATRPRPEAFHPHMELRGRMIR